jgi:hypothetical protein
MTVLVIMFLQDKNELNNVTDHGDKGVSGNKNKFILHQFIFLAIHLQCLTLVCSSSLAFH